MQNLHLFIWMVRVPKVKVKKIDIHNHEDMQHFCQLEDSTFLSPQMCLFYLGSKYVFVVFPSIDALKMLTCIYIFIFRQFANRLVCFFFVFFYHLSSSLAASAVSTLQTSPPAHTQTYINPFKVKLPKSRLSSHLNSFVPLFFRLWKRFSEAVQNSSSLQ